MTATSTSRMVVPFMAFVAAVGLALVFAIQHVRREPPVEAKAVVAAPAISKPASGALDQGAATLAAAQAEANAAAAMLPASRRRAKRLSRAGRCRAQRWNCYAMASCMIARSQINPDNSLWSRPGFPLALTI